MSKNLKIASFLVFGIVVLILIMSFFGISEVIATLLTTNVPLLLVGFAIHIGIIALLALRLILIVRKDTAISLKKALQITITGLFVNFLTPIAKVGGEPVKIYFLKDDIGIPKATAAVAMDTFVEIFSSIIVFISIFIIFFTKLPPQFFIYYIVFIIISLSLLAVSLKLSFTPSWLKKLVGFGQKKFSKFVKISDKDHATEFNVAFRSVMKNKITFFGSLSVSIVTKFFEFARMWIVFVALGLVLPWEIVVIIWGLLLMLFLIPWLPGGLGLIEGGIAAAFVTFGVPAATAASGVLLDRFITFWFILVLGAVVVSKYVLKADEKKEIEKEISKNIPEIKLKVEYDK